MDMQTGKKLSRQVSVDGKEYVVEDVRNISFVFDPSGQFLGEVVRAEDQDNDNRYYYAVKGVECKTPSTYLVAKVKSYHRKDGLERTSDETRPWANSIKGAIRKVVKLHEELNKQS